jgi:microcystin-dependent protein
MEPFIGQIMPVGFNFAPRGWSLCDGQLLAISQNTALFSLLGTTFGGDGRTTFALPDLRGRAAVHVGTGPGLTPRRWGERSGTEVNYLNVTQLPSHNHAAAINIGGDTALSDQGAGRYFSNEARGGADALDIYDGVKGTGQMASDAVITGNTGGGQSVNNMQPWLGIYHCIAMTGLFPSRS